MTNEYTEETYGERVADVYDSWYSGFDESSIDLLFELARGGRALELGIGTGRIALPLARKGIQVSGIDASPKMVEIMRQKPGGAQISVTLGNFADISVVGQFPLIYIVFNTFFALLTQEELVNCFQNVAKHLSENGVFLIEAFVPDLKRFEAGQAIRAVQVDENRVRIDVTEMDQAAQQLISQHLVINEAGVQLYPVRLRFAYPPELDLMARIAGLRLLNRWGSWRREQFTADSTRHISIYGKA